MRTFTERVLNTLHVYLNIRRLSGNIEWTLLPLGHQRIAQCKTVPSLYLTLFDSIGSWIVGEIENVPPPVPCSTAITLEAGHIQKMSFDFAQSSGSRIPMRITSNQHSIVTEDPPERKEQISIRTLRVDGREKAGGSRDRGRIGIATERLYIRSVDNGSASRGVETD
jgi:hypothetical protein